MNGINAIKNAVSKTNNMGKITNAPDVDKISSVFTTKKTEKKRGNFDETFEEQDMDKESAEQAKKFYEGLKNNKKSLIKDLGLSDSEYDSLSCIALALASQETGMGLEKGYEEENTGIMKIFRGIGKTIDTARGGGSASSGLTQIKIHDFMNKNEKMGELFKKYGIESKNSSENNLFLEPDKSAVATMIILSDIVQNKYENYEDILKNKQEEVREKLDSNLSDEECIAKGEEIIDSVKNVYDNLDDEGKKEVRIAFRQWLLSKDDTKIGEYEDNYDEEKQLEILNDLLNNHGVSIKAQDINYVRYALTQEDEMLTPVEYCAYAWNKGTEETGMQPDRLMADKIGVIFRDENFYNDGELNDQFTSNVEILTQMYAQESYSSLEVINNILLDLIRN